MSNRIVLRRVDGEIYLERWGFECKYFGVFVHRMDAPDPGIHLHDHPWQFASIILKGGYIEERAFTKQAVRWAKAAKRMESLDDTWHVGRGRQEHRRWLSFKGLGYNECHRITHLNHKHSWSLVFRGPKREGWGFYTEDGFVESHEYHRTADRGMVEEIPK